ncbi:MAG: NAD-glutamate dehydrogenase [Bdellovibrionales bacterium]
MILPSVRPPASDLRAETLTLLQETEGNVALLSFARVYLQEVSTPDLGHFTAQQLATTIHNLWETAKTPRKGRATLRCYSPAEATHSWQGKYTILDVVQDDMPFLVDSVTAAVHGLGLNVLLAMNPSVHATRGQGGELKLVSEVSANPPADAVQEAWLQFFFEETTPEQKKLLLAKVESILIEVRRAVEDWPQMRQKLADTRDQLVRSHLVSPTDMHEVQTFLDWLDSDHFTFLGVRDYRVHGEGDNTQLSLVPRSGLGILRDDEYVAFEGLRDGNQPPEVKRFLAEKRLLLVTKSSRLSNVHRAVAMDAIFVKQFDTAGKVISERLFIGLFTSLAYSRNTRDIPVIRHKMQRILQRAGLNPKGHDGKALTHILDTYPRDELFQIEDDDLLDISMGIMQLQDRKRVALFVRRDPFQRFTSCLVYVPREAYSTTTRQKIIHTLETSFRGQLKDYNLLLDQNPLARLHVLIATQPENVENPDLHAVEAVIAAFCRSWQDRMREALIQNVGNTAGLELFSLYGDAFSSIYRDSVEPSHIYDDIQMLEKVRASHRLAATLRSTTENDEYSLTLYHPDSGVMLSATLPMIENLGFRVHSEHGPYEVHLPEGKSIWIHDYRVRPQQPLSLEFESAAKLVEDAFGHIWYGHVEDDRFNRLILAAGLTWRQTTMLRMLARYMRQIRMPFAPETIAETLASHPTACTMLSDLFIAKFDPARDAEAVRIEKTKNLTEALEKYILDVPNIDDDQILRCGLNLLTAALRTNFYQTTPEGQHKPYISIKFDSRAIDNLPLPKPHTEIFVYSPRMEGVHLRGGKVARGGIRWSDRREDFRTEVLGLMKAQMVKNTVIVPVGSKGGFIVKNPHVPDFHAEGVFCYQTLMRGMLDITDNIVNGSIVPPQDVVRHDGDDPYLVVAADKGTAKFSDIANGVSAEYGFWLDDAFASGGSAGYDHKQMGITARGAWEAVKRHFRELGIDTQTTGFTCIGIGDMAGDVFGNGLLQTPHVQLIAAFNYAHIFVDPNPDAAAAYRERQHLFVLGKGSWDQYNPTLISTGGGVWPRSQKVIPISPEMQERFGIAATTLSANELIRAIMQAPADLLFFGGIGTYVKAASETDADVGDKANDALRVNANDLRARVIGEGANLGMTQSARIVAAQSGIKLNTDAIDNSAGVDTSDHEVNIKILLAEAMRNGSLTLETRNELLKGMTEEVAALVLRDNYLQTQALSLAEARTVEQMPAHRALLQELETEAGLHRKVEHLPSDEALAERQAARQGLTRPELAVVLAYSKIWFYDKLITTELPSDPITVNDVRNYFPAPIQNLYGDVIPSHPLLKELAATVLTNEIVNRLGVSPIMSLMEKAPVDVIAKAYIILRDAFGLRDLWEAIEALDNKVSAKVQMTMFLAVNRTLEQGLQALVTMPDALASPVANIERFRNALRDIGEWLKTHPDADMDIAVAADSRTPAELRERLQVITWLPLLPRLCHVMQKSSQSLQHVIPVFMAIDARLQLRRLHRQLSAQSADNPWQAQALTLLADDMLLVEEKLTTNMMIDGADDFEAWLTVRHMSLERYDELVRNVRGTPTPDMALWTLVVRELVWLAGL